ncbi:MAG: hypothetical protein WCI05_16370, partial [Myxococcales bacterium]
MRPSTVPNRLSAVPPSRAAEKLREFHEEGAVGKTYDAHLALRLWPFVRPHRVYVAASLGTLLVLT